MNKQNKKIIVFSAIVLLIIGAAVAGWMFYTNMDKPLIAIKNYYDINGNVISQGQQSVIGGTEGVAFIDLQINVRNADTVPLTFGISSATPTEFLDSVSTFVPTEVQPGDDIQGWTSDLIDIRPFEGTTVDFSIIIEGVNPGLRQPSTQTGVLSITVEEDPIADFTVTVTSTV